MNDTALLVIDVQQSFLHRPYWSADDLPAYQRAQTALIEGCAARGVPVVKIWHVEDGTGPFSLESGLVKPMDWLPPAKDVEFHKRVHNAFTGTALDWWLRKRGVRRLLISGIRTEQCCETTARVGSDLGYAVDFITDATLTFATAHPNGRVLSAAEMKERTEAALHGRFATVRSAADALKTLG